MKKLHTFHLWERAQAGMYRELLAAEGVACLVRNEQLFSALGEIPFTECFPELWVVDAEAYPRAKLLLEGWLDSASADSGSWKCSSCGEDSDGQFTVCWHCGKQRDEQGEAP